MQNDQTTQTTQKLDQAVEYFAQYFRLDLTSFGALPDNEQWSELFWILSVAFFNKLVSDESIQTTIQTFQDLTSSQKTDRLIEIRNFVEREMEELEFFNSVYGKRLDLYKIEQIVENLPDLKSKISFLFALETGKSSKEDPVGFDLFVSNLLVEIEPELQVQNRLQKAMNNNSRLNLGSMEDRLSRAISAEEVAAYIQNNQQNNQNRSMQNPVDGKR